MDLTYPVAVEYLQPPQPAAALNAINWIVSDTMDPSDPNRYTQAEYERYPITGGTFTVNWVTAEDRTNALSVQEDGWDGPLFRSGMIVQLPDPPPSDPHGFVDIFVPDVIEFTPAEIADMAALNPNDPYPSQYGGGITTTLVHGAIKVSLTGTKPAPFEYTVTYALDPSQEVRFAAFALERRPIGSTISTGPVPGTGSTHFPGSAQWYVNLIMNDLEAKLQAELAKRAIAAMAAVTIPAPAAVPTALPTSSGALTVVLSARQTRVGSSFLRVWPSLGSFGNLANLLFPTRVQPPGGGGSKCALQGSVLLVAAGLDLALFRAYRDHELAPSTVALWYEHGEEAAAILGTRPELARAAVETARAVESDLRAANALRGATAARVAALLAELGCHGSPRLQAAVHEALA